jgi:hypothetical protein
VGMDDRGPILVKAAVPEEDVPEGVRVDVQVRSLNVSFPEELLTTISENTGQLQEKLNKFVNAMNSRIQSVRSLRWLIQLTSRTNAMVQAHQTQSLKTVAEAEHCTETLKQLIQECEEIEAGWEEVRRVREIV